MKIKKVTPVPTATIELVGSEIYSLVWLLKSLTDEAKASGHFSVAVEIIEKLSHS